MRHARQPVQPDPGLAAALRAARRRSKLTQQQVAARIGVSQPSVSDWERGIAEPSLAVLRQLAAAYGTCAARLIGSADAIRPARARKGC